MLLSRDCTLLWSRQIMVRGRPWQAPWSLGSVLNSFRHSGHSHSVLVMAFVWLDGGPRAENSALTWSRYLGWESLTPLSERFRTSRIIPVLTSLHVSKAAVESYPSLRLPCRPTTAVPAPLHNRANPSLYEKDDSTLPDHLRTSAH